MKLCIVIICFLLPFLLFLYTEWQKGVFYKENTINKVFAPFIYDLRLLNKKFKIKSIFREHNSIQLIVFEKIRRLHINIELFKTGNTFNANYKINDYPDYNGEWKNNVLNKPDIDLLPNPQRYIEWKEYQQLSDYLLNKIQNDL